MDKYEFKGTKENWNHDIRYIVAFTDDDKMIQICEIYSPANDIKYHSPDKARANAHLIAAAPDLLQACIDFVEKVNRGEAKSTKSYSQMKSAIHKALNIV